MPQQTNLNVAPYFDDFDPTNDYHKVLLKPGYPVQERTIDSAIYSAESDRKIWTTFL